MIFNCKTLASEVKQTLALQIKELTEQYHRKPCLQVVLVGNDYGSTRYAESCVKQATEVGMLCRLCRLSEQATEKEVIDTIEQANADGNVDGILLQIPLPQHLSQERILPHLLPLKDVDGASDANVAALWKQRTNNYSLFSVPCTPRSVMRILQAMNIPLQGKRAVVVGRSNIVGLPVSKLLLNENCTVTIVHSRTADLADRLREADIVVAAIGQPRFITQQMIKNDAIVIDVGINSDPETGKMCGDVDLPNVAPHCQWITPVPGGVGQLTICSLIENTLDCFKRTATANR
ncbi:MAG: bifunctional 5,10-methylenetetrahydrofolate dehydrogenase/5,10-methenyltetrahydrofolate cyclohydrolase [Paludibacteraceae bacterium]|nr:bifunctional 5,10-methylenetetrahydrofolate dehydrogenase/5,10-methenyltetrahydrofolate cyclohydrolase [Paludibacteraceae bacterium]